MAGIPACGSDCPRRTLTARQCPPGYCAEAALGLAVQAPGGRLWRNQLTKGAIRGQTSDHLGSLTGSGLQKSFLGQRSLDLLPVGSPRQVDGKRARSRRLALGSADDDGSLLVEGPGFQEQATE